MLDLTELKTLVVRPALSILAMARPRLASPVAENLITGTIYQESVVGGIQHLQQVGSGPAIGIGMIEPVTLHDVVGRWLGAAPQADILQKFKILMTGESLEQQAISNLSLVAAVMRLKYFMSPLPLPAADDAAGLAAYYKSVYNTAGGAARIGADLTSRFRAAIEC